MFALLGGIFLKFAPSRLILKQFRFSKFQFPHLLYLNFKFQIVDFNT